MELVIYYKSILNNMCADQSYLLVYITANSMNIAERIIAKLARRSLCKRTLTDIWQRIISFVDIVGQVNSHCLSFLSTTNSK